MDLLTPDQIDSLRNQGMSYREIGAVGGISKDAARGLHTRWLARLDGPEPRLARYVPGPSVGVRSSEAPGLGSLAPEAVVPAEGRAGSAGYVGFDMGYFDLESSALNGSFGRLFCGACAHVDGSVWVARTDDPRYVNKRQRSDDGKLAVAIRDHLEGHDIIVSWNGKRGYNSRGRDGFDVPMLNARLINARERLMSRFVEHIDLLKEARKQLQLAQYRLASVQTFLELQEEKSAITPRVWQNALDHDKDALDYIVDHNIRDTLVLREVFEEFRRVGLLKRATR